MQTVDLKKLQTLRTRTFNLPPNKRLSSQRTALNFVNTRGFVYFWPIKGIDMPSLWTAVAGDRPVADKHDDPGHITWGWKDDALEMHTIDLRKESKLSNAKDAEFNKALEQLQRDFKILPVGVAQAGAWKYSHIYEITTRHFPDLAEQARKIKESEARLKILELYFNMLGAADLKDANKLFGWGNEVVKRTVNKLIESGKLVVVEHPKLNEEWMGVKEILSSLR